MYRYLFEEVCFDRIIETDKKISPEMQKKIRETLATALGITYEEVRLAHYEKSEDYLEIKLEAEKEISASFAFRVCLLITQNEKTLISLKSFVSRLDPVNLAGPAFMEDIVYNIVQEFSKKSFYQDLMAEYKLKYEELSKKLYEEIEILLGFSH